MAKRPTQRAEAREIATASKPPSTPRESREAASSTAIEIGRERKEPLDSGVASSGPDEEDIRMRAYQRLPGARRRDWQRFRRLAGSRAGAQEWQVRGLTSDVARALWKGSISFGLVNIPIELHTAVRNHRPKFRMLHAKDKSPVRFERVCVRDGTTRWPGKISSKATSTRKAASSSLTKEDFQAAALEKTRTVDIVDFVKADEIDDRFFETPYYLVPARGGERAYALLREAIRESGRIGIAKFILRDAQHLAARRSHRPRARAHRDAVRRRARGRRRSSRFRPPATCVRSELEMAKALVNNLAADWDPGKYTDHTART